MLGYFPRTLSVPRSEQFSESVARGKLSVLRKNNVQGQISEHIFALREAIVSIILQIFSAIRAVLKIKEYRSDISQF